MMSLYLVDDISRTRIIKLIHVYSIRNGHNSGVLRVCSLSISWLCRRHFVNVVNEIHSYNHCSLDKKAKLLSISSLSGKSIANVEGCWLDLLASLLDE